MRRTTKPLLISVVFGWMGAAGPVLAAGDSPPPAALAVDTLSVEPREQFTMRRLFTGRVQARRSSVLGFEAGGRLAAVTVDVGDRVDRGAVLARRDTALLAARQAELEAALAEAQARLALAEATYRRMRDIVDDGGVSRQGLDEAREDRRAAAAAVTLVEQRVASLAVEIDQATLRAPFSGRVIARLADEGRVLAAGDPVIDLQEDATPEIRVGVAGVAVERLVPGEHYLLQWRDRPVAARLRTVLPLRAALARTVEALFDPVEAAPAMRPGDLVSLTVELPVDQAGAWLPLSALTEGERGLWSVFVAQPLDGGPDPLGATHRVARRSVELVYQTGRRAYVRGALVGGEHVVSDGVQRVVPGQGVRLATRQVAQNNR